jgi:Tol biopolymer transport system component
VTGALHALAADLSSQQGREADVPKIEPHFTRVYVAEAPTQVRFPSLSPDGRWIVFSTWGTDFEGGLWLVPADGGEAIPLTKGHWDDGPVWFPSGDRIAFRSDRPARDGSGGSYVMSLAIDPETGQPTGPPRQVSVDRCFAWLDVAPDGESIAFSAWAGDKKAILVVPSAGGASRYVARATTSRPVWSPDGESLYYVVDRSSGDGTALMRVSAEGSDADTVFTWPQNMWTFGYPQSRFVLRVVSRDRQRNHASEWELTTLEGRALARFELPPGMFPFSFTPGGELLADRSDGSAPLEVLPIDGGSPQRLNETRGNDQVLGWSGDGRQVLFKTALDGEDMLFFAPTDGGPMRQLRLLDEPLDAFAPVLSQDGRHLLYVVLREDSEALGLMALELETGETREITDNFFLPDWMSFELSGRGGVHWRDGDEFLYVERHGNRFEIRAAPTRGPSRLLRTFHGELPGTVAVYDDRIAYADYPDRDTPAGYKSLMLARAGDDQAQVVLSVQGALESATWSPDGRRLTVNAYRRLPPGPAGGLELLSLEINPSGEVVGEPKVLDTPNDNWWWSPRWLPNGRGLLVQDEVGDVWRISAEPGVRPVAITADLPPNHEVWDFRISPDGRFIAYARSISQGSSIWRVDLGDALAGIDR